MISHVQILIFFLFRSMVHHKKIKWIPLTEVVYMRIVLNKVIRKGSLELYAHEIYNENRKFVNS